MPAPQLVTQRLVLRAHSLEDFDPMSKMYATPEVYRFIGGEPLIRDDVWSRLLRSVGHWELLHFGFWVITSKADGGYLGEAEFSDFHRDIKPPLFRVPEIGWALVPEAHGQGLATEAMRKIVEWGDATLEADDSVAMIQAENAASIGVATKLGFHRWRTGVYKGQNQTFWKRTRAPKSG